MSSITEHLSKRRIAAELENAIATDLRAIETYLASFKLNSTETLDDQLFSSAVELLGRLQQKLSVGAEQRRRDEFLASFRTGRQMISQIAEYLAGQFGGQAIDQFRPAIRELGGTMQSYERLAGTGVWTRLFGITKADPELSKQMRAHIGEQLCRLFVDMLFSIVPSFHTDGKRRDWESSCEVFIEEFRSNW